MIDWEVAQGDHQYRVRAVKRGVLLRDNGEGANGLVEALIGFVYEHLMNLGPRFKVGVLRETARDELGWAPNHLLLLYREVLPKGTDPTERANELRNLALAGHFDTWEGRRRALN